jgi:hypothetical protein
MHVGAAQSGRNAVCFEGEVTRARGDAPVDLPPHCPTQHAFKHGTHR